MKPTVQGSDDAFLTKRINLRVNSDLHSLCKSTADVHGFTLSDVMRAFLAKYASGDADAVRIGTPVLGGPLHIDFGIFPGDEK